MREDADEDEDEEENDEEEDEQEQDEYGPITPTRRQLYSKVRPP